jgi:DNA-directed RNA polymerase subunit RPC12/RpoP
MPFKPAKCPNCAGDLQVPDDRDAVKCMYCGSDIMVREATKLAGGVNIENLLVLAKQAEVGGKYDEAYKYYSTILEYEPQNASAWMGKALTDNGRIQIGRSTPYTSICFKNALEHATDKTPVYNTIVKHIVSGRAVGFSNILELLHLVWHDNLSRDTLTDHIACICNHTDKDDWVDIWIFGIEDRPDINSLITLLDLIAYESGTNTTNVTNFKKHLVQSILAHGLTDEHKQVYITTLRERLLKLPDSAHWIDFCEGISKILDKRYEKARDIVNKYISKIQADDSSYRPLEMTT